MHTKLQLKAFLLHQNLIYNLYGNILPAVISFMLPLSNYYNIGSESYFPNVPLFNYKVIFKYSYFLMLKNATWPSMPFVMLLNCRLFLSHFFSSTCKWGKTSINQNLLNYSTSQNISLERMPWSWYVKLGVPFVYLQYMLPFC